MVDEEKDNLQQHFQKLAQRYPLKEFEKSMSEFIQMVLQTMDVPVLDQVNPSITQAKQNLLTLKYI